MALLYIFCNLLPARHPWHRYHGCGGGRSCSPPGKRATTLLGSPSASTVGGLTTPVPCCHTFCSGMGGWDSHANSDGMSLPTPRYLFLRRSATPSGRHSIAQKTASISLCLGTSACSICPILTHTD